MTTYTFFRMHKVLFCLAVSVLILVFCAGACFGGTAFISHLTGSTSDWDDFLIIDNVGTTQQSITVKMYNEGEKLGNWYYTVAPMEQVVVNIKETMPGATCGVIIYPDGYEQMLNFRLAFESRVGEGVAEFNLDDERGLQLGFFFSSYTQALDWKGIAIFNYSGLDTNIELQAWGDTGVLDTTYLSLANKSRVVGLCEDWFPNIASSEIKNIFAISTYNISGIVVSGSATNDTMAFTKAKEVVIDSTNQITGVWRIAYDWECNEETGDDLIMFSSPTVMDTQTGYSGSGSQLGDTIRWEHTSGTAYTGTIAGDGITGTMTSYQGVNGCWSAERDRSLDYLLSSSSAVSAKTAQGMQIISIK